MLKKSRNNLYLCLVNIKNKIEEVKNEQLESIENKRMNVIKNAKTIDEFEFILEDPSPRISFAAVRETLISIRLPSSIIGILRVLLFCIKLPENVSSIF